MNDHIINLDIYDLMENGYLQIERKQRHKLSYKNGKDILVNNVIEPVFKNIFGTLSLIKRKILQL